MDLIFQELIHLFLSLLAGSAVYYFYGNRQVFIWALISGFFIDTDHWFDNWMAYGPNFDLAKFFAGDYFAINGTIFVPLHGWEYVVILALLGIGIVKYRPIFYALALSLFLHLSFDVFSNNAPFEGYSVLHRIFMVLRAY
ncbi:hypothetical protein KKE99_00965 [Patescibacteria group bacterium]|nr:hypothetical protein [Patescibacteria group bacterium]